MCCMCRRALHGGHPLGYGDGGGESGSTSANGEIGSSKAPTNDTNGGVGCPKAPANHNSRVDSDSDSDLDGYDWGDMF